MQTQTAQEVYSEIVANIDKQGGTYSSWYCGIASDWEDKRYVPEREKK
jgi:hypothetical protein